MASTTAQQLIYGQFVTAQTTGVRTLKLGGSGRTGNGPIALSLTWSTPTAARTLTIPDPGGDDTFTMNAATQTLTNKTFTAPVFTGQLSLASGTVAAPSLTFTGDLDTGLYRIGANNIGVAANGAKVLDIATTGLGVTGVITATTTITAGTGLTVTTGNATITAGNLGIQASAVAQIGAFVNVSLSGSTSEDGIRIQATVDGSATARGAGVYSYVTTANTAFTAGALYNFYADTMGKGAAATVTSAFGMLVKAQTVGGTNNFGIDIEAPSGGSTLNIGLRNAGTSLLSGLVTASNGLTVTAGGATITAGNLTLTAGTAVIGGAAASANIGLDINNNGTYITGANLYGMKIQPVMTLTGAGTEVEGIDLNYTVATTGSNFNVTNDYGIRIRANTKTGGGTVTNSYGLFVAAPTIGGTLNIGISNAGTTNLVGAVGQGFTGAPAAGNGIQIGAASTNNAFSTGSQGAATVAMFIGNAQITAVSDVRIKANITPSTINATDLILRTPVVDHTWNHPEDAAPVNKNSRGPWVGITAQDLIKTMPWLVNAEDRDCPKCLAGEVCDLHESYWQVDFDMAVPAIFKAFQEMDARIKELEGRRN